MAEDGRGPLRWTLPSSAVLYRLLLDPIRNPHLVRPVIVRRALQQRRRIECVHEEPVDPGTPRDPAAPVRAIAVVGHLQATPAGSADRGMPHMQVQEARRGEPRVGRVGDRRDHLHRVPSRNRGTRLGTSNRAAGSVTSTSSVSLRYTFTSVTVTVWRLASTTVQSWGESWSTRQPWDLESSRTSTACWVIRSANGLAVGLNTPSALVSTSNSPSKVMSCSTRAVSPWIVTSR